jgi:hypothetical protein
VAVSAVWYGEEEVTMSAQAISYMKETGHLPQTLTDHINASTPDFIKAYATQRVPMAFSANLKVSALVSKNLAARQCRTLPA